MHFKNVLKLLPNSVNICMFISINTTIPPQGNLRAEIIFLYVSLGRLVYACTVTKEGARCDIFSEIMNQIVWSWTKLISLSFSHQNYCFCYGYFMSLKRMVSHRNVNKTFSALNFTITCIKHFTSNNTTFLVSFLNAEWDIFSPLPIIMLFTINYYKLYFNLTGWLSKD